MIKDYWERGWRVSVKGAEQVVWTMIMGMKSFCERWWRGGMKVDEGLLWKGMKG